MKTAVLFYLPATTSSAVRWRWHSVDGRTDSAQSFPSYDDCLGDARASGYLVEATLPPWSAGMPFDRAGRESDRPKKQ